MINGDLRGYYYPNSEPVGRQEALAENYYLTSVSWTFRAATIPIFNSKPMIMANE